MHCDIVIAKFQENLDWLKHEIPTLMAAHPSITSVTLFIYCKGGHASVEECDTLTNIANTSVIVESLENIGREAHTYLYHVIKHYTRYSTQPCDAPYVFFLQGSIADHKATHYYRNCHSDTFMKQLFDDAVKNGKSITFAARVDATYDLHIQSHGRDPLFPEKQPFGKWFESNVGMPLPNPCFFWVGALFCVGSNLIKNKSVKYFENLLHCIPTHSAPEVAHFFERSWVHIFDQRQIP